MLKNYFTTAFRQLRKHHSYTALNVVGLSLGLTGSLVLFLLVRFWTSFDTYHAKADRIYRVVSTENYQGTVDKTSGVPTSFPDAFRSEFPQVEASVRAFYYPYYRFDGLITLQSEAPTSKRFQKEKGIAFSESTFFHLFDRPLVLGDARTALDAPNAVVVSERWADTFFGPSWRQGQPDLMGQTLSLDTLSTLHITGVMKDHPINTDLPFDMLISYTTVTADQEENWENVSSYDQFFVLLDEENAPASVVAGLAAIVDKYHNPDQYNQLRYTLQPLTEMHFDTDYGTLGDYDIEKETVWALIVVAIFLVLIACVNFVNLTTAVATQRAKEVGVRKVLGGTQRQLVRQFLSETTLITVLSVFIALGLTEVLLLKVNSFLKLSLALHLLSDPVLLLFLLGLVVGVSLLSGLYPAWVLARFRPADAFKATLRQGHGSFSLRKGLIVFQFVIAQVLIIGTLVLIRQMNYVRQVDLGYDRATVMTIPAPGNQIDRKKTLRDRLMQLSEVEQVSLIFSEPTSGFINTTGFVLTGNPTVYYAEMKYADSYYLDTYGLRLLAGRGLDTQDTLTSVVVNETLLREVGIDTPEAALGQVVEVYGRTLPIRGVVQDFNTQSLRDKIAPTMLVNNTRVAGTAALRLQSNDLSRTLAAVEEQWKQVYDGYNYEYAFQDEELAQLHEREHRLSVVLAVAAGVIILIGCLGLYGLVTFMAEQKTKEIGIRKVLGASVGQLIQLFSAEFVKLILLAFLLAAPLAYYLVQGWLENFEYKITPNAITFVGGLMATLVIALLTVSYRSVRAATANPVDSLRNE